MRRYRAGKVPLNSAEGFIRQIIGWREYVRGIYWLEGPDYAQRNFLDARRDLPAFYWTGDTDMFCLKEAIGQTLATAHAHHIQRLMVTGNFALLIGANPAQVHKWYLEIYVDAYEWVELPNTLGMSQFGDGGLLGSKPYAVVRGVHQPHVGLLPALPIRREPAGRRRRLPIQRALLGFPRAQRGQDRGQSPAGDALS